MERTTKKIIQALTYIAYQQQDHKINSMKAYKLLWLADRYHLRQYGRTITGDVFYALPHGVVPSDAKNVVEHQKTRIFNDFEYCDKYIKRIGKYHYQAITEPDVLEFSDSDQDALDKVLRSYGSFDQYQLEELSHNFPEWLAYKDRLEAENSPKAYKIDFDYFFDDAENDNSGLFADDPEKLSLIKSYFHEFSPC
jgi:uncharacterized phage-associated protein